MKWIEILLILIISLLTFLLIKESDFFTNKSSDCQQPVQQQKSEQENIYVNCPEVLKTYNEFLAGVPASSVNKVVVSSGFGQQLRFCEHHKNYEGVMFDKFPKYETTYYLKVQGE